MADEEENECCPLCMEELDITDKTFNACPCGYQVCLWCWHQIKNEYNALCPACRAPYSELSKQKSPLDREDVLRRTKQRKQKEKSERRSASQSKIPTVNRRNLANVRVMQRNLVYIIGLPQSVADDDVLRSNECFGQYGKIVKAVVNKAHLNSDRSNATASAYITFASKDDAMSCIIAVDGFYLEGSLLRASFGTTKYCNFFLRNMTCNNPDCLYLHELGEQDDSFTKDEMQSALHASKAAFRDLTTNEIRAGSRFPPPVKTGSASAQRTGSGALSSAASAAGAASAAASHPSSDRQAQSAAAIYKLRQTHSSAAGHNHQHHHPDLRRGNSYSRIVTGFASSSSSSSEASSSPPSSPSPSTPPPPHVSSDETSASSQSPPAAQAAPLSSSSIADDRRPNLRVDTSVGGAGSATAADGIVGPLEALKLATGSSSQEPAWAMPFPSPSLTLHNDTDDSLSGATDAVFSPFGLGFDQGIRSSGGGASAAQPEHDPWSSTPKSRIHARDTAAHDEALAARFGAPPSSSSSGFPIGLNDRGRASGQGSAGLSGLSFASIDAIFSHRDESADSLAGLMGAQLAPPQPSMTPTASHAPAPLIHSSPSGGGGVKSGHSSRFAFANHPAPSPMSELREPPMSSRGPPPMSGGLPPTSPYRPLSRYSSFREVSGPPSSSMFPSPNDPRAFPPLGSNAPPPPPPLPPSASSASSHVFARSTSDPFPSTGFGGLGDSNGLAFLQQMLPNVNISYGGDFPSSPSPATSAQQQDAGWGGLAALGFDANAQVHRGSAIGNSGLHHQHHSASHNNNGGSTFYDPAIVAAPGLSGFYGLGDDDRLRQQSAFGGSFRQ